MWRIFQNWVTNMSHLHIITLDHQIQSFFTWFLLTTLLQTLNFLDYPDFETHSLLWMYPFPVMLLKRNSSYFLESLFY